MDVEHRHGGNRTSIASRLGCRPSDLLDASASLVPWTPRLPRLSRSIIRDYPDRSQNQLRCDLARLHGVPCELLLAGNGAAELFTWAARDAARSGQSLVPSPGFADYSRALGCWDGPWIRYQLPLSWSTDRPQPIPQPPQAEVLWICNPHNPTGQLWSRASLEPLLKQFRLVISDEAFLPLVPDGEQQSLIPLVAETGNLVVIRSLTKLYGIAGLRLGYAVAQPERLQRWAQWRDPWPVNGIALAVGQHVLSSTHRHQRWCRQKQAWAAREGAWMQQQLAVLPGITPMPSAVNYLLVRANRSLLPLREALEQRHRILLRDCRSFEGLGENWLRIGLQSRRNNRRIVSSMRKELSRTPLD